MAFYLWMRFDVNREAWPQWHKGEEWQFIKLLKGKGQFDGLTYDAQLKYVRRAFEGHGLFMKAWTHAGRHAGVLHGETLSIPDTELRRLGHWDSSRMAKHYSSGVSREAAREMAGHKKGEGGYYLSRECLVPPTALQRLVFPRLEESLEYIDSFEPKDRDKAAQAFLLTLQWFRVVLLQDAVILSDMFPESPMWQMYPFREPQFLQFKQLALQKMEEDEHPQNIQLQKTIPVVADRLLVMSQIIADGFRNVERIVQTNQETDGHLVTLTEALLTKTGEAQVYLSQLNRGAQGFVDAYKNAGESSPQMPQSSTGLPLSQAQRLTTDTPDMPDEDIAPQYIPEANIESVERVYEEWYEGLIGGSDGGRGPAMGELEKRHKTGWRKDDYVRKRFQRRRDIIRRLDKTAQRLGVSGREAARRIELWKQERKMSLDKLRKAIKANQELWGANDIELS